MRHLTFSIILLFLCVPLFSQSIEILDKALISGSKIKVQSLFEYEYKNGKPEPKGIRTRVDSFDIQGNKIAQLNFRETGSVQSSMSSKYDFIGNRTLYAKKGSDYNFTQSTRYDRKGNKLLETGYNGVDSFRTVYNYNKLTKLAEVNYFIKKNLDEKRVFTYIDNVTEIKVLDGNGNQKFILKFTYNNEGKIIEESQVENNNTISRKIIYTYDSNGYPATETKFLNDKIIQKLSYTYSKNGQLLQTQQENADGSKFISNIYKYNAKNQLIEEQWKTDASREYSKSAFTYDDVGVVKTIDSYYANFKRQMLSVFIYEYH